MSRFGSCDNEREHQDKARDDARWGYKDHEQYDRYGDACQRVYAEEFDREQQRREERREEERQQEEAERRDQERRHQQRLEEFEEDNMSEE